MEATQAFELQADLSNLQEFMDAAKKRLGPEEYARRLGIVREQWAADEAERVRKQDEAERKQRAERAAAIESARTNVRAALLALATLDKKDGRIFSQECTREVFA